MGKASGERSCPSNADHRSLNKDSPRRVYIAWSHCIEFIVSATRKEVERRGQENERVDKRVARPLLITEQKETTDSVIMVQRKENQRKIFTYEEAFLKIKEASHEADVEVSRK